jgi:hypothetical protein
MLKPQDLLVTLKFASLSQNEPSSFSDLAQSLSMSASEVFAATKRAIFSHLLVKQSSPGSRAARYHPLASNLREFLLAGLRYVFPAEAGKVTRGFCTAQDAPPLVDKMVRLPGDFPFIWPHSSGDTRGVSITPLFRSVPDAAKRDVQLFTWLAPADALRIGDARVRSLAANEIEKLIAKLNHARPS